MKNKTSSKQTRKNCNVSKNRELEVDQIVVVRSLTYKPVGKIFKAKDIQSIWNVGMGAQVSAGLHEYDSEEKINVTVTLFQPR